MVKASLCHICKLEQNHLTWGIWLWLPLISNSANKALQQALIEIIGFDFEDLPPKKKKEKQKKKKDTVVVLVLTGISGSGILFSCCYLLKVTQACPSARKHFRSILKKIRCKLINKQEKKKDKLKEKE